VWCQRHRWAAAEALAAVVVLLLVTLLAMLLVTLPAMLLGTLLTTAVVMLTTVMHQPFCGFLPMPVTTLPMMVYTTQKLLGTS
jgi:hypothetical protein